MRDFPVSVSADDVCSDKFVGVRLRISARAGGSVVEHETELELENDSTLCLVRAWALSLAATCEQMANALDILNQGNSPQRKGKLDDSAS